MKYFCCDDRRRDAIRRHGTLNGLDFLEVVDNPSQPQADRQRFLLVHFIQSLTIPLTAENFIIEGGERIPMIEVVDMVVNGPDELQLEVDTPGDFSTYTLRLVDIANPDKPPDGIDILAAQIDFSFKVNCPSDFDCLVALNCPPELAAEPDINYLAKDYAGFRRLMLDRLSLLMPEWRERNPADVGVMLVEVLAYVGDRLSYQQDAISTEAYLETARSRVSVRRHARLVDYNMHDGFNARAWVQLWANSNGVEITTGTQIFSRVLGKNSPKIEPDSPEYEQALKQHPVVFETMEDSLLYEAHNEMSFYTWGSLECCLPRGATTAALQGHLPNLKAGDILIFVEKIGPKTGFEEDADPAHRHPVRLTHVALAEDLLGGQFLDPPTDEPVKVTEISWAEADALPFPLCVSSETDEAHGSRFIDDVSLAMGNIVLADHGRTVTEPAELGEVPPVSLYRVPAAANGEPCAPVERKAVPPRYRPYLPERPLTMAIPIEEAPIFDLDYVQTMGDMLDNGQMPPELAAAFAAAFAGQDKGVPGPNHSIQGSGSVWSVSDGQVAYRLRMENNKLNIYDLLLAAAGMKNQSAAAARPAVRLESSEGNRTETWKPRLDLLNSKGSANEFVVETEADGVSYIRFGDGVFGRRPSPGTAFKASYRVGGGKAGNIGAESLSHVVTNDSGIEKAINYLPAWGGKMPETMTEVRQKAPYAFRTQERAVTTDDYARIAERHPSVSRAAATLRWTGSWHTVFLTIDRVGGLEIDQTYEKELQQFMDRYRMAGHDVEIDSPRYVSLELDMTVCARPDYFRGQVAEELLLRFSSGHLPGGRQAVFHPDNFTFGQPVYLSQLYAAAQEVDGVESVTITKFQRQGQDSQEALDEFKLTLGRLEIARLENNPNFPERGVFRLTLEGGK